MAEEKRVVSWILAGKQVGATSRVASLGKTVWVSVAVQAWQGKFLVYVCEILEDKMAAEEYEREEYAFLNAMAEVIDFVSQQTRVEFCTLCPCKGQKLFNPAFAKR